jgi:hypothetical protein
MIFLFGIVSDIGQIYANYYTEIHKGATEICEEFIYLMKKILEKHKLCEYLQKIASCLAMTK